jgi:hypothetical protein
MKTRWVLPLTVLALAVALMAGGVEAFAGRPVSAVPALDLPPEPRTIDAVRTFTAPTLNGSLGEWTHVPETVLDATTARYVEPVGTPPTASESSLTFRAMWDNDHLYFGIHVRDQTLKRDSGEQYYWDDQVVIWVDGDGDGAVASEFYDHQYAFLSDGLVRDWGQATTVVAAHAIVAGGWDLEVAIPASELPSGSLLVDQKIHLTFGYHDDDDGGRIDTRIEWEGLGDNNATAEHYGFLKLAPGVPTSTPTVTPTSTATPTPTMTPTATPTSTPTNTPTPTVTPTATPPSSPDLSASTKSASPQTIGYFEQVTYEIVLSNTGTAPAQVSLVDVPPLPYLAGSAVGGIWWDDGAGAVRWEGTLAVNETRLMRFKTHGPTPVIPHDTVYINTALLYDGVNPPVQISASVLANPAPTPTVTPTATATPTASPTPTVTPTATPVILRVWVPLLKK